MAISQGTPAAPRSHQKLEEGRNDFFPRASRGSAALLTSWFWPSDTDFSSGLQNSKRINVWRRGRGHGGERIPNRLDPNAALDLDLSEIMT